MTPPLEGDELSELYDADIPRVDLVGKGANGIPRFLIAKQDGDARGLVPPDLIRELIGKQADPDPQEQVTMTGSPAAIAKLIHEAGKKAADEITKAPMSTADQNDLPDSAFAYIEPGGKKDESGKTTPRSLRHFPVNDAAHVRDALSRAPQSPFGDKAMPKIRAAAKKFSIDVSKEAGMAAAVTKDMNDIGPDLDDGVDGLDPTVPLAAPEEMAPGDPTDPGSPAWESIDAATAQKWTAIAVRLKNALDIMSDREMIEAASGADPDDADSAWDLQDAMCAVDYVIDTLAGFAVGEQAEADLATEAMDSIGKAMSTFDATPLDAIEGLAAVKKSGRVLSTANEQSIRNAAAELQKVLASLPAAPQTTDSGQAAVAKKETAMADTETSAEVEKEATPDAQAAASGPVDAGGTTKMGESKNPAAEAAPRATPGREVVKAALPVAIFDQRGRVAGLIDPAKITQVAKADGGDGKTPMQAVFDADGNLVGIVDPSAIIPVAGASPDSDDASADADGSDGSADDGGDMTPQPAADAGTPAGAVPDDGTDDGTVAKQDSTDDPDFAAAVAKSVTEAIQAALTAQSASHEETVAKQASVIEELTGQVDVLKARVEQIAETPAAPKVFTNGQTPPAHQMRGQDQGAAPIDVAKAMDRKRQLYGASDATEQNRIAKEMMPEAVAALAARRAGHR